MTNIHVICLVVAVFFCVSPASTCCPSSSLPPPSPPNHPSSTPQQCRYISTPATSWASTVRTHPTAYLHVFANRVHRPTHPDRPPHTHSYKPQLPACCVQGQDYSAQGQSSSLALTSSGSNLLGSFTASVPTLAPSILAKASMFRVSCASWKDNPGLIQMPVPVLLQAMREDPPLSHKCKDKFLVQSMIITADRLSKSASEMVSSASSKHLARA